MFIPVQGVRIFCEVTGEGLPLVFLHGLGSTGNVWNAQRVALGKSFQVITVDLPGSGRSDKSERQFSMGNWVGQIAGLADALKLDRFVLIGHSMSTVLAQRFAAKYGSRLTGLVLCGAITELAQAGKESFARRAENVQKEEGMLAVADTVVAGALTAATREANPALAGMVREMLLANDTACYAGHCHALREASAKADQPQIKCPTLVLVGDQDAVTPLSWARAVASGIAGARLRVVPGTAHMTMIERPELFNALLVEFLLTL
jgi:pimeloyl-ACP methyl ester carboxylesterase